jgi:hypothetical protein
MGKPNILSKDNNLLLYFIFIGENEKADGY